MSGAPEVKRFVSVTDPVQLDERGLMLLDERLFIHVAHELLFIIIVLINTV